MHLTDSKRSIQHVPRQKIKAVPFAHSPLIQREIELRHYQHGENKKEIDSSLEREETESELVKWKAENIDNSD